MKVTKEDCKAKAESFTAEIVRDRKFSAEYTNIELLNFLAQAPVVTIFNILTANPSIDDTEYQKKFVPTLLAIQELAHARNQAIARGQDSADFEAQYRRDIRSQVPKFPEGTHLGGLEYSADEVWKLCTGNKATIARIISKIAPSLAIFKEPADKDLADKFTADFAEISIRSITALHERFTERCTEIEEEDRMAEPAAAFARAEALSLDPSQSRPASSRSLSGGSVGGLGSEEDTMSRDELIATVRAYKKAAVEIVGPEVAQRVKERAERDLATARTAGAAGAAPAQAADAMDISPRAHTDSTALAAAPKEAISPRSAARATPTDRTRTGA